MYICLDFIALLWNAYYISYSYSLTMIKSKLAFLYRRILFTGRLKIPALEVWIKRFVLRMNLVSFTLSLKFYTISEAFWHQNGSILKNLLKYLVSVRNTLYFVLLALEYENNEIGVLGLVFFQSTDYRILISDVWMSVKRQFYKNVCISCWI